MIWMEVRCDKQDTGNCYSARNNGPKQMAASNSVSDVSLARTLLLKEAARQGWTVGHWQGVICPVCAGNIAARARK